MTLTKELGAVPPPSHSWIAPLVEDMLHDVRTGLNKAVMTGPGRTVLFFGIGNWPSHNGLPGKGERAGASMCKSVDPTTF